MTNGSTKSNPTVVDLTQKLGRPLRILHIGNIANNAYNNARIQRQYGIDADVLSYDYYHVMSTPEWEDAEFDGAIDPDSPNWWGTSLRGWKRPTWFVQGPSAVCLQYLRAKHLGLSRLQNLLWRYLEARCLGQVRYSRDLRDEPLPQMPFRLGVATAAAKALRVADGPPLRVSQDVLDEILALRDSSGNLLFDLSLSDLDPSVVRALVGDRGSPPIAAAPAGKRRSMPHAYVRGIYRLALDRLVYQPLRNDKRSLLAALWLKQRRVRGLRDHPPAASELDVGDDGATQLRNLARLMQSRIARALSGVNQFYRTVRGKEARITNLESSAVGRLAANALSLRYYLARREVGTLTRYNAAISTSGRDSHFRQEFHRIVGDLETIKPADRVSFLCYYGIFGAQFFDIFDKYDIIQTYSIDGCLCVVNGLDRFLSYEHGTLRDLPFGNDFYGIATRLAYHASTGVFVTNSDVLPSVERMGLDPARVVCLPHAFDDRKLMSFRAANPDLQPAAGPPIVFSPTRQHWKDKSGSWTKGNDILLRAAALVAAEGHDFRLHLVAWGKELEDSKALIAELGICDKVVWLPTMQKRELWRSYCTAHAVADQFVLPALGGVGFETMALGRRLITSIDRAQLASFFGEAPPCLAATTIEQCAEQLRLVIRDPDDRAGLGIAAQRWMSAYHSAERIVALQAEAYSRFLQPIAPRDQD
jgi:glycosyltransferase involved in cell wall biosynthesis